MSRAAVFSLLSEDATLASIGGTGFTVVPSQAADQRPNDKGAFIVIVWGSQDFSDEVLENGPQRFDLYVHLPVLVSTDYVIIDRLIDRCDEIFAAVEDGPPVVAGDGWQLNFVGFEGRGPSVSDRGYRTICRRASYAALSCKVSA